MMEKLGAPQTHLGLKAMIKVNNEQKSICFSFLLWSFRDQVHLSNFLPKKILALLIFIFASFLRFEQQNIFKMWENQWDNLPNFMEGNEDRVLPMVDVSGSMSCPAGNNPNLTCMDVAISLGIYISERNEGTYGNQC